jgi:uncharacterized protein (UPF0179 family)
VFRYEGQTDPGCASCKLVKQCHSKELKPGREYRIGQVRPVKHDVCHVFEGLVQVVDVDAKPLPVRMAIPVSAARGTGVTKRWVECGASCLYKSACNPTAIPEGGSASLLRVGDEVPCLVGRKLRFAQVEPGG